MNTKRAIFLTVLVVAVAAMTLPLVSFNARAAGSTVGGEAPAAKSNGAAVTSPAPATQSAQTEISVPEAPRQEADQGKISAETLNALGITRLPKKQLRQAATKGAQRITSSPGGHITPLPPGGRLNATTPAGPGLAEPIGLPAILNTNSALSAALITTIGGRDNQFSEVALIADWDGREDCVADRGAKIDDFSTNEVEVDVTLTRAAISEHTRGNGHPFFNVYYYGDSAGNVYQGVDLSGSSLVDIVFSFNVPELINTNLSNGFALTNPIAGDCTDDQVTVTGIAVNPVADLGDLDPTLCGTIGEVVYVSVADTEGCASNAGNLPIRTRILVFGLFEGSSSGGGFIQFTGVRQIMRSRFVDFAGLAVDDDGSLYYQLIDLIQFTGGGIFKATELCRTVPGCGATPRINRVIPTIPDPPTLASWVGTQANPIVIAGGVRNTNYGGGVSTLYGDIVALATGPCNVLYAAVSASFVAGPVSFEQLAQGLFPAPSQFGAAGTPSMIISFADCSGAFDVCSGVATGSVGTNVGGTLPVADGFADVATAATTTRIAGVNNFRIFAQGNGPNIAPAVGGTGVVPGTPSTLLKIDMQIDYTTHSGLAVNEEGTVFVISGGTPAGVGKSPSPMLGEVLCFEDACPMDRRADPVDLRGDQFPNPPSSGGNAGDGDSDRFDHIFYQAPIDVNTATPAGLSGLARGFLRYTNRLVGTNAAAVTLGPGVTLGSTKQVQGDDDTDGTIIFENLDPGHQVAGGDDQNFPFFGDDDDGAGTPPIAGALRGGFEFLFGGPVGGAGCVWNGFFLNSNGNLTFGTGDTSFLPTVPAFRQGRPRLAAAWADLNPSSRSINLCTFPVQALGFANVNAFRVRWINVPEKGREACVGLGSGPTNTFSVTLYDDGVGIDENANQPLNPANPVGNNAVPFDLLEGPTDFRFTKVNLSNPATTVLVNCFPRPEGSGIFVFEYCRMDLLGTPERPVLAGYSIGFLNPLNNPPAALAGLCESNLSVAAAAADAGAFGVLAGGQIAAIGCSCCIGEGTEPTIFELFNEGRDAGTGAGGEVTFARPDFDLRFEGNDAALCTSTRQRDLNRGKICFLGVGCAPPANPICRSVVTPTFATTPNSGTDLVDALCAVPLNIVGCGFFPNEVTIICQGFAEDTGIPLQRPGKTVTTAATLACDTNGDSINDAVIVLSSVTPVNCNLITATIPVSGSFGTSSSSGFPAACCGGPATIVVTTTFTAGDNNVFGPFTRTAVCSLNLGTRAPIVFSVTPSNGDCSLPDQDLLISGACFTFQQFGPFGTGGANTTITQTVTSVFAIDRDNPANIVQARAFVVLNNNLIDAHFNFGSANAGKTFFIFVTGPGGTSRNLTTLPANTPAGCPLGNEQGIQVVFKCNTPGSPPPCTPGTPGCNTPQNATVTGCKLDRQANGTFFLDVTGTNIKSGALVTVGGIAPKKIKVVDVDQTNNPTKLRLVKRVCGGLPGNVIITNPGAAASAPFLCTERCPAN